MCSIRTYQRKSPRTCSFQETFRAAGGRETTLCLLDEGVCPFQRGHDTSTGRLVTCAELHGVPTDWQIVELDTAPVVVRDVMTTAVVSVTLEAPVPELARMMLDENVHRLLVLDPANHPVGIVSVDDLLQVLAQPEAAVPGGQP